MAEYSNPFQNGDLFYKFVSANKDQQNNNNLEVEDVFGNTINFSDYGVNRIVSTNDGEQNLVFEPNTPQAQEFDTSFMDRMAETHYDPNSEPVIVQPIQEQTITQPTKNQSVSINPSISNRAKYAVKFFMDKGGFTFNQAAGIVGNLMHESGDSTLNNITKKGDKGTSYGMAQWRDEPYNPKYPNRKRSLRWTNLKNFAKSRGKSESDFETQLEFVLKELTDNPNWIKRLRATTTIEGATRQFMQDFENPNKAYANFSSRLRYAKSLQ